MTYINGTPLKENSCVIVVCESAKNTTPLASIPVTEKSAWFILEGLAGLLMEREIYALIRAKCPKN